jgi:hypothetical protein
VSSGSACRVRQVPAGWAGPSLHPDFGNDDEGCAPSGRWRAVAMSPAAADWVDAIADDPVAALLELAGRLESRRALRYAKLDPVGGAPSRDLQ